MILNTQFSIAQNKIDSVVIVNSSIDLIKERNAAINIFANSLNNYSGGRLPAFLFDKCFDLQSGIWEGFHSPVSLRWKVLEKVNNKNALKLILDKNDRRLKRKCSYDNHGEYPQLVIPMIEKSFCQLLWERYEQLN